MRKRILVVVAVTVISFAMGITSFAGQWHKNDIGWWWEEEFPYPIPTWKWIDGNQDGIAECYYISKSGYLLVDTMTPDGYTVNADGAWVENGVVQTKKVEKKEPAVITAEEFSYGQYSINMRVFEEMNMTFRELLKKHRFETEIFEGKGFSELKNPLDGGVNSKINFGGQLTFSSYVVPAELKPKSERSTVYDTYYYDLDETIYGIVTNINLFTSIPYSISVDEFGQIVSGMGASNVKIVNRAYQVPEEIVQFNASGSGYSLVPTGRYRTKNETKIEFDLNGLHFSNEGANGVIIPDVHEWTVTHVR